MKQTRQRQTARIAVAAIAAACIQLASWGAPPAKNEVKEGADDAKDLPQVELPKVQRGTKNDVTDAQVVSAMKKGIDFLLSQKKVDNWETGDDGPKHQTGGHTAIALYALLHAGDSLQDVPDYHAKLHWRGKELAPVIEWLSKIKPDHTYTAGLEASALTLVPRRPEEKPGEGPHAALEACKWYLLDAMGVTGGYSYTSAESKFPAAWAAYLEEALKGNRNGPSRKKLDQVAQGEYRGFGGPLLEMQRMAAELLEKRKAARDPREIAKIEAEMKELDNYLHETPAAKDPRKTLAEDKTKLDDLVKRNGDPTGLTVSDGSGGGAGGGKSKKNKKPMTKEELAAEIERLKTTIAKLEDRIKNDFVWYGDLSNGQYGTLGAWALSDFGIEMPNSYWEAQDLFWRKTQMPDGSWPYSKLKGGAGQSKPTMGVAGIASLFIAQEFVDTELRLIPKPDKSIDAGLAWLAANYKPSNNLYYMYGVERVGLNSGLKFFGTADWYREGAAAVIRTQAADGSWSQYGTTVGTSYALLFLARGRNPVVFNKLQYNGPWNARPRDDAYVTRWMSKRFEKPINWQVVNLQVSPEEWMDAPVLLITGSEDPKFTKDDIEKLRAYVNAGGMIFSTADGNSGKFTNAIKKVATEVVNDKFEMRQLPKSHSLFSKEMGVDLPNPPVLLGMSNGVRELWIHSPVDIGADWQMRKFSSKNFELGAALYFYASGMGSLKSKLQPLTIASAGNPARSINVARVDYSGNSDPEPGAWARLAKLARADYKTEVKTQLVKCADLDAKKYPLAHLTGSARVTFDDDAVKGLKAYLDGGGMLFVDVAGGGPDFASSAAELLRKIYPDAELTPVPLDHPLFTGSMPGGEKLGEVEFRKYGNLQLKRRVIVPAMEQIVIGGRTKVLFSRWDICSGFLGTNTWGILGYAPKSAETLGRNILLYSLNPVDQPSASAPK